MHILVVAHVSTKNSALLEVSRGKCSEQKEFEAEIKCPSEIWGLNTDLQSHMGRYLLLSHSSFMQICTKWCSYSIRKGYKHILIECTKLHAVSGILRTHPGRRGSGPGAPGRAGLRRASPPPTRNLWHSSAGVRRRHLHHRPRPPVRPGAVPPARVS
jgi:hypothetical protein